MAKATLRDKIRSVSSENLKKDIPEFRVGDTVKINIKIQEDEKTRIQAFEGIVIRKKKGGINATFTVRRISYGEGVERTFPLHSPSIEKIVVVRKGTVKRAKLYYLRQKIGKKGRIEEKIEETAQESSAPDQSVEQKPIE